MRQNHGASIRFWGSRSESASPPGCAKNSSSRSWKATSSVIFFSLSFVWLQVERVVDSSTVSTGCAGAVPVSFGGLGERGCPRTELVSVSGGGNKFKSDDCHSRIYCDQRHPRL